MSKEKTKICKYCNEEIPKKSKKCPSCGKKQPSNAWKIILIVIVVLGLFSACNSILSDDSSKDSSSNSTTTEKPKMTEQEFKDSCKDIDYKAMMRNPDDYIGQNFKVTVKVSTKEDGYGDFPYAYKCYAQDEDGDFYGDYYYFLDARQTDEDGYVKVLEDDYITVYGTFDGLLATENALNGSTSEEMSLNIYYVDLHDASEFENTDDDYE